MFMARDPGSLILIILAIATSAVIFWRIVIKLVIIGAVSLVILGLLELWQGLH